jgi:hypothetical protein
MIVFECKTIFFGIVCRQTIGNGVADGLEAEGKSVYRRHVLPKHSESENIVSAF